MAYRMIALDLDGTALDSRGRIRPRTREAVSAAVARGLEVVVVTGRHHVATRPYHRELALPTPAICCNGTYLYDFAAGRAVDGAAIDRDAARRFLALCRRHGMHCLIYDAEAMTYETANPHLERFLAWAEAQPEAVRPTLRQVDFDRLIDTTPIIWKFVVSHPDPARLSAWCDEARAATDFNIEYSWHDRVDVMPAGMSKGARLVAFAAARGIATAEIVAFGDNGNDITMIAAVGHGIAMGNAEAAVKAAAAETVGDNDSDAIADAIERLTG